MKTMLKFLTVAALATGTLSGCAVYVPPAGYATRPYYRYAPPPPPVVVVPRYYGRGYYRY